MPDLQRFERHHQLAVHPRTGHHLGDSPRCQNTRTAVYVGDTHSAAALYRVGAANGGVNIAAPMANQVVENYQACCIGVYSNKVMQLDAKSGMVSEQVFSQQLGEQLRLSNSAQ